VLPPVDDPPVVLPPVPPVVLPPVDDPPVVLPPVADPPLPPVVPALPADPPEAAGPFMSEEPHAPSAAEIAPRATRYRFLIMADLSTNGCRFASCFGSMSRNQKDEFFHAHSRRIAGWGEKIHTP
jgi:hypothetical protein